MPRRCSTCSTASTVRHREGLVECVVCDLLERAETRDASARVLHELAIATGKLGAHRDDALATTHALDLAIGALEGEARNLRHVARCVSRTLEPHRRARRGARA